MHKKNEIILPLYYFPNLWWWKWYQKADIVYFNLHEKYIKQSFRNRTCIKNPQGRLNLSIPVAYYPQNETYKNIRVADSLWKEHHYKSIYHNYRKSAFFEFYQEDMKTFFETCDTTFIWQIALQSIEWMIYALKIPAKHVIIDTLPEYSIPAFEQLPNEQPFFDVPPYYQLFGTFLPNLSGLDALFCAGKMYFAEQLSKD